MSAGAAWLAPQQVARAVLALLMVLLAWQANRLISDYDRGLALARENERRLIRIEGAVETQNEGLEDLRNAVRGLATAISSVDGARRDSSTPPTYEAWLARQSERAERKGG